MKKAAVKNTSKLKNIAGKRCAYAVVNDSEADVTNYVETSYDGNSSVNSEHTLKKNLCIKMQENIPGRSWGSSTFLDKAKIVRV